MTRYLNVLEQTEMLVGSEPQSFRLFDQAAASHLMDIYQ